MAERDHFDDILEQLADRNDTLVRDGSTGGRGDRGEEAHILFLRELTYALEAVSLGTHQLLYFAGMKYARNHLHTEADTLQAAVTELADRFDAMNVGTLTRVEEDGKPVLEMAGNALTMGGAETDKPLCYFLSGYIAGYLENALGTTYMVNETDCIAQGAAACRFRVLER